MTTTATRKNAAAVRFTVRMAVEHPSEEKAREKIREQEARKKTPSPSTAVPMKPEAAVMNPAGTAPK